MHNRNYIEHLWHSGQEHLGAMRYGAAAQCLQSAEAAAWRAADPVALARIHLPLLEARRQIRYQAADGITMICPSNAPHHEQQQTLRHFLRDNRISAGTLLIHADPKNNILHLVQQLRSTARRQSRWLEALLLITHGNETRIVSPGDPVFAGGLRVKWTRNPGELIGESTATDLDVPLPGAGRFAPGDPLQALIRESLIVGWEALALKWQHRHPPQNGGDVWEEIAWLRRALQIDPACEPIAMRLMALAEAAGRCTH